MIKLHPRFNHQDTNTETRFTPNATPMNAITDTFHIDHPSADEVTAQLLSTHTPTLSYSEFLVNDELLARLELSADDGIRLITYSAQNDEPRTIQAFGLNTQGDLIDIKSVETIDVSELAPTPQSAPQTPTEGTRVQVIDPDDDYAGLVGTISEVIPLDSPEHESENSFDDVVVNLDEEQRPLLNLPTYSTLLEGSDPNPEDHIPSLEQVIFAPQDLRVI